MRRLPILILLSGVLALTGSANAETSGSAARVVVSKRALMTTAGSGYAEYGLVLTNTSRTLDALNVVVTVKGLDARGRAFTTDATTITVIPAGGKFVVTGALVWGVSLDVVRLVPAVRVGRSAAKGRRLPRVSKVVVDSWNVKATITNPYVRPLPDSAIVYGVFLDSEGRMIAAGSTGTAAVVRPGASVPVEVSGNFDSTTQLDAVASAALSVDPCGYKAGTRACPIAGARR